jgi:hypothetical protein
LNQTLVWIEYVVAAVVHALVFLLLLLLLLLAVVKCRPCVKNDYSGKKAAAAAKLYSWLLMRALHCNSESKHIYVVCCNESLT